MQVNIIIIIVMMVMIMMMMRISPALNSCLVFYITSQLPPPAQRCNIFLSIRAVSNKDDMHPVISSIPRYSCHFAQSLETVLRAPLTNGTTTTSTWCILHSGKANSGNAQ